MQNIDEYTSKEGCESSIADAVHDFHGIFKGTEIKKYVDANIPTYKDLVCDSLSEDKFVDIYALNLDTGVTSGDYKSQPDFISTHISPNIRSRYEVAYISRPQHENLLESSLLQKYFNEKGILNDIFFICDVAYSNIREDLKNVDIATPQTFYWVQNAQTLYDPAGKTSWHSDKPYFANEDETGDDNAEKSSSKASSKGTSSITARIDCPNHFKKENSKFLFCWQDAVNSMITLYPEWSKKLFPKEIDSYKFSQNLPEQMLYTNKNMFLSIRTDNIYDYSSHEAYLIITDPTKPGYYGYADKVLSARGSGILSASDLASYRAKGNELKRFVKFINSNIRNPGPEQQLFLDEVMNYSSYFQVIAKKVGDASQSISCCQPKIKLQKFRDNVVGLKAPILKDNIINFESNGNHAFISYDRIAVVCALNYNSPIVIGNTPQGFTVYIRKDLINIHKQFDIVFQKKNEDYQITSQLKSQVKSQTEGETESPLETPGKFILNQELYDELLANSNSVKEKIKLACFNLNTIPSNDISYQNFLINYFIELNILQLFSTLDTNVLQFDKTIFNNKIKEKYTVVLEQITSKSAAFEVTNFGDLGSVLEKDNINDIMNGINSNVTQIINKLKEKYDSLKGQEPATIQPAIKAKVNSKTTKAKTKAIVAETTTETDPNQPTFLKILGVLKIIEKMIIDINEIQKSLLSNLQSMKKIQEYQDVIVPAGNDANELSSNIDKLPKGVATNITTCTPYTYYITNSRTVRNSDVFFERSTSIFGTTTVILQIFNTLNCDKLNKLKDRFVKTIYDILNYLEQKATVSCNITFVGIVHACREQFKELLITEPNIVVEPITPENINNIIDLGSAPAPLEEEEVPAPLEQEPAPARLEQEPAPLEQEEETSDIRKIFIKKKLFIKKSSVNADMTFRGRIDEIRDATESVIPELLNTIMSDTIEGVDTSPIQIAYENEVFIKGFIGLFAFMKYIEISKEKKVPILFTKRETEDQSQVLQRLFELLYLNLDDPKVDINILQRIEEIKRDIQNKLPGFDFEIYKNLQTKSEKNEYILTKLQTSVGFRRQESKILEDLETYIKYCQQIESKVGLYEDLEKDDANPPTYKNDFTVNSFRKLLEMNVITVGSKELEGNFVGINANEINANMALLYFIENRIASLNKDPVTKKPLEPIPHPELIGLFSQLFKDTGLNPREYITPGQRGGDENDIFDTMYDLFMSNDKTDFNNYRKNSYLLLSLPTNYELSIGNFQFYPNEIRTYLQNYYNNYIRDQKREEQNKQLQNPNFSKGPNSSIGGPTNNNMNTPVYKPQPISVLSGKTKTNKNKNKKIKTIKNKNKNKETIKIKTKKNQKKRHLKTKKVK